MRHSSLMARAAVAAASMVLAATVASAAGATPATSLGNVQPVMLAGDTWWNYDFVSSGTTANVDWPVDVIFYGQASLSKVTSRLGWIWPGSNAYQQLDDNGTGTTWVANAGRKTGLCSGTHIRLYADSDGALWNPILGYYVIGTAHLDNNECTRAPTYGFNETAEANVATRWASRYPGDVITRDAQYVPGSATPIFLGNAASGNYDHGVHTYNNNGYPTLIQVR